ncbi:nitroreductase family protein [Bifidobacterium sp.]|jgi:nitroreductase|uniref:nitroreductase family protein n=1 Tax=Bifidobacterium sp. TaxID=41200 RepID=UPI0025C32B9E|nr:nitroreductase family protein [Bifidobacterium sp.]MCI1635570.1 nitroreductase family protein [Bifidobacterium sp.]
MAEHTRLIDAIDIRKTTRNYDPESLAEDHIRKINATISAVNTLSGLHIQLINDCPEVFAEANTSGHFTNANNVIAIVGPSQSAISHEQAGFYAQRIVLAATLFGLGTGWVAGSWDRQAAEQRCSINPDEALYLGITIGYPADQARMLSSSFTELREEQLNHRSSITLAEATSEMDDHERNAAPSWFLDGVRAALKAPSAMNRQTTRFRYEASSKSVTAYITPGASSHFLLNDLGIAKLHFQIGAGGGTWQWGDKAAFTRP